MGKIRKSTSIAGEAQYIREKRLDHDLVKVFCSDVKGTNEERGALNYFRQALKDDFYVEIMYIPTHKIFKDTTEAKKLYLEINIHKKNVSRKLKRGIGIEVAVLDYLYNIKGIIKKPKLIEQEKMRNFAQKVVIDETTKVHGRSAFNANLNTEIKRTIRYNRPLSLLFSDLDNFKRMNHSYESSRG